MSRVAQCGVCPEPLWRHKGHKPCTPTSTTIDGEAFQVEPGTVLILRGVKADVALFDQIRDGIAQTAGHDQFAVLAFDNDEAVEVVPAAELVQLLIKWGYLKRADVHHGVPPQRTPSRNLLRMSDEFRAALDKGDNTQ